MEKENLNFGLEDSFNKILNPLKENTYANFSFPYSFEEISDLAEKINQKNFVKDFIDLMKHFKGIMYFNIVFSEKFKDIFIKVVKCLKTKYWLFFDYLKIHYYKKLQLGYIDDTGYISMKIKSILSVSEDFLYKLLSLSVENTEDYIDIISGVSLGKIKNLKLDLNEILFIIENVNVDADMFFKMGSFPFLEQFIEQEEIFTLLKINY